MCQLCGLATAMPDHTGGDNLNSIGNTSGNNEKLNGLETSGLEKENETDHPTDSLDSGSLNNNYNNEKR